ncbi:MAG: hypothetical protein EXS03_02455 [Phycisphaerales bacterium]|nr:hypothetical protein [Phycisphaerales bacterium]
MRQTSLPDCGSLVWLLAWAVVTTTAATTPPHAPEWREFARLKAPEVLMPLGLGPAVAASDTGTIAVGGGVDHDLGVDAGAVSLWQCRAHGAEVQGVIRHPALDVHAAFGSALAFGSNGTRLVIGAPCEEGERGSSSGGWPGGFQAGAVYLYEWSNAGGSRTGRSGWHLAASLRSKDPRAGATFGAAVASSGDRVVIGSPGHSYGGFARGLAEVFVVRDGHWHHEALLLPKEATAGTRVGSSVGMYGMDGEIVVVGSPGFGGGLFSRGRADVFRFGTEGWRCVASLEAPSPQSGARFGASVAVTEGLVAVGAPHESLERDGVSPENAGVVHLFRCKDPGTPSEQWHHAGLIVSPSPWCGDGSQRPEAFGIALAMRGDLLAIGASEACVSRAPTQDSSEDGETVVGAGVAYLMRVGAVGEHTIVARLAASGVGEEVHDGYKVALGEIAGSEGTDPMPLLVVGRLGNPDLPPGPGCAHAFVGSGDPLTGADVGAGRASADLEIEPVDHRAPLFERGAGDEFRLDFSRAGMVGGELDPELAHAPPRRLLAVEHPRELKVLTQRRPLLGERGGRWRFTPHHLARLPKDPRVADATARNGHRAHAALVHHGEDVLDRPDVP